MKFTGELIEGATIDFLGRRLRREGETIKILGGESYIDELLAEHGLQHAHPVVNPGTNTSVEDGVSTLTSEESTTYRR